jgi:hypothetical protein
MSCLIRPGEEYPQDEKDTIEIVVDQGAEKCILYKKTEIRDHTELPEEKLEVSSGIADLLAQMNRISQLKEAEQKAKMAQFEKVMAESELKSSDKHQFIALDIAEDDDEEDITDEMLQRAPLGYIQDSELPVSIRLKAVEYAKDHEGIEDTIQNLLGLYEFAPVTSLENILHAIGVQTNANPQLKFRIGQSLTNHSQNPTLACDVYSKIVDSGLNTTQRLTIIIYMLSSPNPQHYRHGRQRLHEYLTSSDIDCEARYRAVINDGLPYDISIESIVQFISNTHNDVYYRILACQAFTRFIQRPVPKPYSKFDDTILSTLLAIAADDKVAYNRRADAADIAYREYRSMKAGEIIKDLGDRSKDLFENKQNVHFVDTSNILKTVMRDLPVDRKEFDREYEKITDVIKEDGRKEVLSALARIELDYSLIKVKNTDKQYSSREVLWLVWTYISTLDEMSQKLARQRLVQELYEAADTCPSGHSVRILNALSSINGLTTTISWKDQVISNFKGRMMALIRKQPPELRGDLMSELIDSDDRPNLKKFVIKNLGPLVAELHKEFVGEGHIDEDDFGAYIQDSIMFFEGYHM